MYSIGLMQPQEMHCRAVHRQVAWLTLDCMLCVRPMHCSELELRKSGATGRVVIDAPEKYPAKEDIGILCKCCNDLTNYPPLGVMCNC